MTKVKDKVKFYPATRKDKAGEVKKLDVPVFLFFSLKGIRLQYFTGVRVEERKWDYEIMRVKADQKEAARNNKILDRLKRWVEEIADNANALGIKLTLEEFRNKLKERTGDTSATKKPSGKTFIELYDEYIETSKLSKKEGTIKALRTGYNNLIAFSKATRTSLTFDKINQEFYNKLLEYCFTVRKFKNNSTGKLIKDLKAFLNWATEEGHNTSLEFKKKGFKMLREEPEIIYLTYDELILLYERSFEKPHLENAKNVFCFGCFTGMRFSDILALTHENIHNQDWDIHFLFLESNCRVFSASIHL
ncbi:MAG: site-specific integrase [Bacteroidia bacterium]